MTALATFNLCPILLVFMLKIPVYILFFVGIERLIFAEHNIWYADHIFDTIGNL